MATGCSTCSPVPGRFAAASSNRARTTSGPISDGRTSKAAIFGCLRGLRLQLQRVDRRVDARLGLGAREAGGNRVAEAEGDGAGAFDETAARRDAGAVERDGNDRQIERAIEAGEAGAQRRLFAGGDAGA